MCPLFPGLKEEMVYYYSLTTEMDDWWENFFNCKKDKINFLFGYGRNKWIIISVSRIRSYEPFENYHRTRMSFALCDSSTVLVKKRENAHRLSHSYSMMVFHVMSMNYPFFVGIICQQHNYLGTWTNHLSAILSATCQWSYIIAYCTLC